MQAVDSVQKLDAGQQRAAEKPLRFLLIRRDHGGLRFQGAREGVAIGQTFKVGTSEILRDPATGETLDVAFTEKGRIKVDNAKEKISICSVVSGDGLESGMSVAPPTP